MRRLPVPSLFVFRGNDQGARFELSGDVVTFGRDSTNVVQLHDTEVSRRHAELRLQDGVYVLFDLGSSNGTFVNAARVDSKPLASGDELQLGRSCLLYTADDEEPLSDLAKKIDIVRREQPEDRSRIVHALREEEGSRIFTASPAATESPWLARARNNLQVMYRTALAVSHTLDIDQLLSRIMQLIFEWVEADRGVIMLVDPDTKKLEPKVRRDRRGLGAAERMRLSQTILDYVLEKNEGVLTSNAQEDARWNPAMSILHQGVNEAICVPMRGRYDMVGVIYIDTTTPAQRLLQGAGSKFTEDHLKLMIAIAHQAALAVEDTRHYSALVQAERLAAVGQTIATLSHHIKNILQGIRGGSYLIKEGLAQHDENLLKRGWEFVEKNQERISNLVLDMLTFSKEREPDLQPADLNATVADVVELMTSRAADKQVELVYAPAEELPTLTFDAEALHRAVLNVVGNAIDACAELERPGRVEVRTRLDPGDGQHETWAVIEVRDNGVGIEPEEVEKIFSLFVSHKGARGTGLGLPVSDKILREHGGRIRVESTPGEGSCFFLELPAGVREVIRSTSHA